MTAPDPQHDDPRTPGATADLKRGARTIVLALLALIAIVAIAVALTNIGGDDDPSGGGEQGLGPTVTQGFLPAG
jgi:hypothetical protein